MDGSQGRAGVAEISLSQLPRRCPTCGQSKRMPTLPTFPIDQNRIFSPACIVRELLAPVITPNVAVLDMFAPGALKNG